LYNKVKGVIDLRKLLMYLIIYSVGGFFLERIINLIFLGDFLDNSVLWGPIQPMYGLGVVITIIIYDKFIKRMTKSFIIKNLLLLIVAILATAVAEASAGYGYELLTGKTLWDYSDTFTCSIAYVCLLPTSIFGLGSFLVVKFVHPFIKIFVGIIPKFVQRLIILLLIIDVIYTLVFVLDYIGF